MLLNCPFKYWDGLHYVSFISLYLEMSGITTRIYFKRFIQHLTSFLILLFVIASVTSLWFLIYVCPLLISGNLFLRIRFAGITWWTRQRRPCRLWLVADVINNMDKKEPWKTFLVGNLRIHLTRTYIFCHAKKDIFLFECLFIFLKHTHSCLILKSENMSITDLFPHLHYSSYTYFQSHQKHCSA